MESVEILEQRIEALYKLKDDFLIPPPERDQKIIVESSNIAESLDKIMTEHESFPSDAKSRARIFFLKGKAINALSSYDKTAETLLSKAVRNRKLDTMISFAGEVRPINCGRMELFGRMLLEKE
jgi:hypothetical protein